MYRVWYGLVGFGLVWCRDVYKVMWYDIIEFGKITFVGHFLKKAMPRQELAIMSDCQS